VDKQGKKVNANERENLDQKTLTEIKELVSLMRFSTKSIRPIRATRPSIFLQGKRANQGDFLFGASIDVAQKQLQQAQNQEKTRKKEDKKNKDEAKKQKEAQEKLDAKSDKRDKEEAKKLASTALREDNKSEKGTSYFKKMYSKMSGDLLDQVKSTEIVTQSTKAMDYFEISLKRGDKEAELSADLLEVEKRSAEAQEKSAEAQEKSVDLAEKTADVQEKTNDQLKDQAQKEKTKQVKKLVDG